MAAPLPFGVHWVGPEMLGGRACGSHTHHGLRGQFSSCSVASLLMLQLVFEQKKELGGGHKSAGIF